MLWVDEDLTRAADAQWLGLAGARLVYRIGSQVALGADLWGGRFPSDPAAPDALLWGAGPHLVLTPLADRAWAADPILDFGLEAIRLDDGEDRTAAFVFGAGLRRRWGSRWSVEGLVRNRFLSVEEEPVEDVATGRDANLWEIALELDFAPGGHGR